MKIKTSELSGVALDWAVAQVSGEFVRIVKGVVKRRFNFQGDWTPSTDWSQCGPLIERFELEITRYNEANWAVIKQWDYDFNDYYPEGETILIAACRAIVASKLGDEVDVPEGLV